jgi:hypothetical protein
VAIGGPEAAMTMSSLQMERRPVWELMWGRGPVTFFVDSARHRGGGRALEGGSDWWVVAQRRQATRRRCPRADKGVLL